MKLTRVVLRLHPLEWTLTPFRSLNDRGNYEYYFLCFSLLVVRRYD